MKIRKVHLFFLFGGIFLGTLGSLSAEVRGALSEPPVVPTQAYQATTGVSWNDEVTLLSRLIAAEAGTEPYVGKVAVGAVVLNRTANPAFPNTISGVIYQPGAFESVSNGLIWRVTNLGSARQAALDALNRWDPTGGALYFWNPAKTFNPWVWTRTILTQIGRHLFGR